MKDHYKDDLKVVYKHFLVHPNRAKIPATAACAADNQGKYSEMEGLIWEKGFKQRDLSAKKMDALATELELDMAKFKADMGGDCDKLVQKDWMDLRKVGAGGTPTIIINGHFFSGPRSVDGLKIVIDRELKLANERIRKGEATVENYYQNFVGEKGKKKFVPPPQ